MTLLFVVFLVFFVPSAIVALMLARASAVLDRQDEAEMERYRDLQVADIAGEGEEPILKQVVAE